MFDRLAFGTAGIPHSAKSSNVLGGIRKIKELGLDCMELEFVYGVKMQEAAAREVNELADNYNVILTAHGPYYINLNGTKEVLGRSIERILHAAKIANMCGAWSVTFHAGFYQGNEPDKVYEIIKQQIIAIVKILRDENNPVRISPEITGKNTQFGTLEELVKLSQEIKGIGLCVDFSHYHAKTAKENSYKEFSATLEFISQHLGKEALEKMHIHVSGIEYTDKGERKHLDLEKSDFKYKELLKALKDFKVRGSIICESPNLEEDALLLKKTYMKMET